VPRRLDLTRSRKAGTATVAPGRAPSTMLRMVPLPRFAGEER